MVAYIWPKQKKKEESERPGGERDQIKLWNTLGSSKITKDYVDYFDSFGLKPP